MRQRFFRARDAPPGSQGEVHTISRFRAGSDRKATDRRPQRDSDAPHQRHRRADRATRMRRRGRGCERSGAGSSTRVDQMISYLGRGRGVARGGQRGLIGVESGLAAFGRSRLITAAKSQSKFHRLFGYIVRDGTALSLATRHDLAASSAVSSKRKPI